MSNIVRAIFGGSKTTRTRRLWKIDMWMLLQFVDLNLPTAYQVHFANTPASGQAKVVTATSDTVEIPYEYLQTGADVYAWVYLTPENGVGYTEYMVTIPVYARPDTTDEEPTPAQQSALDTAISALNSGVESVQAAVAGVQDSIDTALQEAKDSGEFDGYTPVKGVDYFDGERGEKGEKGDTGSTGAKGDKGDKGDTGADGYSPVATVTQTETGATVTVTDKTGTTTAEISNGQDGTTFTPAVSAEGVISWTNDGGKTNPQPVNIKGPQGDDYILTATDKEEIAQQAAVSLESTLDEKAPVIYCEASGAIASFTDGADDLPVQDLTVQIEPVQAGSGDPSPDNVRPITGWTVANVQRTGKNLLANKKVLSGNNIILGADVIGSPSSFDMHSITLPAGTYTLSVETADGSGTNLYAAKVGVGPHFARATNTKSITFTLSETTDCRLWAYKNDYSTVGVVAITQFQLELGANATDYEPYQGETYDIQFPTEAGTVYGGSLDVTTGVLTVDRAQIASYAGETLPSTWISDRDVYSAGATPTTGAQVVYELATPQTYQLTPTEVRTLLGQNNIWADTGDVSVAYRADTKKYVDDATPVQDVQVAGESVLSDGVANVPIATTANRLWGVAKVGDGLYADNSGWHINRALDNGIKEGKGTYLPLTPSNQQVSTFYGLAKAAGSDEKNSTLPVGQYTDEAKVAIQKMLGTVGSGDIAYIEPTLNAQRAYEYGDYFVDELGVLSRATDAIAQGGSLVLNTNYEHVSDNGGLTAGIEQEAELVADVTVGSDVPTNLLSVPLSRPCKRIVVEIKNNNNALPKWSYIRLNNKSSAVALNVSSSSTQVKYAYCIIDLVNKIGITLLKNSVDLYDNAGRMAFGTSSHILQNHVIREIGFSFNTGMVEGFNIKVYGR